MRMSKWFHTLRRETARTGIAVLATATIVLVYQGCSSETAQQQAAEVTTEAPAAVGTTQAAHHEGGGAIPNKAICVLSGTKGNKVKGTVTFEQTPGGVMVRARVSGLTPGKHGFHIHQYGDISADDGTSTGGHFNPAGVDHAGPTSETRHVGDLGNLEAGENGKATYKELFKDLELHGENGILARGVTIHAGEDDLTSQPTGAAGARVAVGVIGVAKSE